ncbi:MAG: muramidase [Erysipelotrichia bacterium]|nr:rod-binding protein [Candidatus Riflebacteria bacterium]NCB38863.1 muramidase [Erysipelotrichia bacterium]
MSSFSISSALQSSRLKELPEAKKKELGKLEKACSDFESIFMHQMLKEMRKTVKKTGMVSGGQAEEIFSDMLDEERAKTMNIGLGNILFMQLSKSILPPVKPR